MSDRGHRAVALPTGVAVICASSQCPSPKPAPSDISAALLFWRLRAMVLVAATQPGGVLAWVHSFRERPVRLEQPPSWLASRLHKALAGAMSDRGHRAVALPTGVTVICASTKTGA